MVFNHGIFNFHHGNHRITLNYYFLIPFIEIIKLLDCCKSSLSFLNPSGEKIDHPCPLFPCDFKLLQQLIHLQEMNAVVQECVLVYYAWTTTVDLHPKIKHVRKVLFYLHSVLQTKHTHKVKDYMQSFTDIGRHWKHLTTCGIVSQCEPESSWKEIRKLVQTALRKDQFLTNYQFNVAVNNRIIFVFK